MRDFFGKYRNILIIFIAIVLLGSIALAGHKFRDQGGPKTTSSNSKATEPPKNNLETESPEATKPSAVPNKPLKAEDKKNSTSHSTKNTTCDNKPHENPTNDYSNNKSPHPTSGTEKTDKLPNDLDKVPEKDSKTPKISKTQNSVTKGLEDDGNMPAKYPKKAGPSNLPEDAVYVMLKGFQGTRHFYAMSTDGSDIQLLPPLKDIKPTNIKYRHKDKKAFVLDGDSVYEIRFPSMNCLEIYNFKKTGSLFYRFNSSGTGFTYSKDHIRYFFDLTSEKSYRLNDISYGINRDTVIQVVSVEIKESDDLLKCTYIRIDGFDSGKGKELFSVNSRFCHRPITNVMKTIVLHGDSKILFNSQKNEIVFQTHEADHYNLSPNDRFFVFSSKSDGIVHIFDVESEIIVKSIDAPGNGSRFLLETWSPDSKFLYLKEEQGKNDSIYVLSTENWNLEKIIDDSKTDLFPENEHELNFDLASIELIAFKNKGIVELFKMDPNGSNASMLREYETFSNMRNLQYSPRIKRACFSQNSSGFFIDFETMQISNVLTGTFRSSIHFNSDCTMAASVMRGQGVLITIRNFENPENPKDLSLRLSNLVPRSFNLHDFNASFAQFTDFGAQIEHYIWESIEISVTHEIHMRVSGIIPELDFCRISNDEKRIAYYKSGELNLYNCDKEILFTLAIPGFWMAEFSPDGSQIAVLRSSNSCVDIYDTGKLNLLNTFDLVAPNGMYFNIFSWSRDSRYLYVSTSDSVYTLSADLFDSIKTINFERPSAVSLPEKPDDGDASILNEKADSSDHTILMKRLQNISENETKCTITSERPDGSDLKKRLEVASNQYNFEQFQYSLKEMKGGFVSNKEGYIINLTNFAIRKFSDNVKSLKFNPSCTAVVIESLGGELKFRNLTSSYSADLGLIFRSECINLTDDNILIYPNDHEIMKWRLQPLGLPETINSNDRAPNRVFASQDGNFIAYHCEGEAMTKIYNTRTKIISITKHLIAKVSFSPIQTMLAYLHFTAKSDIYDVYVRSIDEEDSAIISIPEGVEIRGIHSWSSDGKLLYLEPFNSEQNLLVIVSMDTKKVVKIVKAKED